MHSGGAVPAEVDEHATEVVLVARGVEALSATETVVAVITLKDVIAAASLQRIVAAGADDGFMPVGAAHVLEPGERVGLQHRCPDPRNGLLALRQTRRQIDADALGVPLSPRIPAHEAERIDAAEAVQAVVAETAIDRIGVVVADDAVGQLVAARLGSLYLAVTN